MCQIPDPNYKNSSPRYQVGSPVRVWSAIAIIITTTVASAVTLSYSFKPQQPVKSLANKKITLTQSKVEINYQNFSDLKTSAVRDNNSVIKNKNIIRPLSIKPSPIGIDSERNSTSISSLSSPKNSNLKPSDITDRSPSPIPQSEAKFMQQEGKEDRIQTTPIDDKILRQHLPVTTNFSNQLKSDRASALPINSAKQTRLSNPNRSLELSLSDVVALALQNNRDLKNAYLERIAQRQDLELAESKFKPTLTPTIQFYLDQAESAGISRAVGNAQVAATVSLKIPTGADLTFGWQANTQNSATSIATNNDVRQNLTLRFNQPLLRGGGIDVNRASIEIARSNEQANILSLKSTLMDTINSAIFADRNLLQAQEQLRIEELSLASAKESLELVRVLIEAGRQAPVEIVQNQTAIANREVSLVAAKNNLETVKIDLLKILNIANQNIDIVAVENLAAKPLNLDVDSLKEIALANRPDYLQSQLRVAIAKSEQLITENNQLWNLDFFANYDNQVDNTQQLSTGFRLSRTLGDRNLKRDLVRSRVNFQQAENNLQKLRQTIELELINEIKNVNSSYQQVKLAQQARELAERNLEIEKEKLKLGRSDIFQLLSFQDNLGSARNSELNATINYLNALTRLDRTVGTTLQTWQLTIEPRS